MGTRIQIKIWPTATTTILSKEEMDSKIDKNTHNKLVEKLVKKLDALEKKLIDKNQKIEEMEKKLLAIEENLKTEVKLITHDIHFPGTPPEG